MKELICIICPKGCHLSVDDSTSEIVVTGYGCDKGIAYAKNEVTNPVRVITSTVRIEGGSYPRIPVKTNGSIPKPFIAAVMKELDSITLKSPVGCGDVVISNVCGSGVDIVTSRRM